MGARGEEGRGREGNRKEKEKDERRREERREREGKGGKERREEKNLIVRIFYWKELPYILYTMSVLNYTVYFLWTSLNIIRIMSYLSLEGTENQITTQVSYCDLLIRHLC